MPKFEIVSFTEIRTKVPAKLLPLVKSFKGHIEKLKKDEAGRLILEKGDDPKDIRRALKAATLSLNKRIRFLRGEDTAVTFCLQGRKRRRKTKPETTAGGKTKSSKPKEKTA